MTASCPEVRVALSLWDPHLDLPERLATHLAGCPGCLASFDDRFARVALPPAVVDPGAKARLLGPDRRRVAPLLLVALALVGIGIGIAPRSPSERTTCEGPSAGAFACEDVAFGEPDAEECASS